MQELGSIQDVGRDAYTNNATSRKAARDKGGEGRQFGQNAAAVTGIFARKTVAETIADEWQNTLQKSLADVLNGTAREVNRSPKNATFSSNHSAADYWKMDRNFGVEELSYKNMWKVLKTVVREIGDIKEANSGRFFLGVDERLEKFTTLMQFGSIGDYLDKGDILGQKPTTLEKPKDGKTGWIMADPKASIKAQANVTPGAALNLLAGARKAQSAAFPERFGNFTSL